MRLRGNQAFYTSLVLHAVVLLGLFLATLVEAFRRDEPEHVFEMVAAPQTNAAETQPRQTPEATPPQPEPPDMPEVPELRDPRPAPSPEAPEAADPPPRPPERISYEEFRRRNPERRPPQRATSRRPRVERPEINTEDVTASLRELLADQDAVERAESMSSADQDALRRYGARVKARLDGAWRKPSELAGLGLVVRVVFDVSEGGRITNVRIRSSSGNGTFDQSVLSAFRRVGAVGPPPDGRSHTFTLTFRMAR